MGTNTKTPLTNMGGGPPRAYVCHRAPGAVKIDGDLDKAAWRNAPRSPRFVDLVTGDPGLWDTRMAALWDDEHLYVAFWVEEPNLQAKFTERDSPVYLENDIEIFIGGEDCYYEFQINALGTVYEVFYIWQDAHRRGGRFDLPEFDLFEGDVDVMGGFQDALRWRRHPRGRRWAFMGWDFPGMQTAVRIDGTLNDPSDVDRGWTVEAAFPWDGMRVLAGNRALPPRDGDEWRMDFSRFQALDCCGRRVDPSPGWSLDAHGVYDSHLPERFSRVRFVTRPPDGERPRE